MRQAGFILAAGHVHSKKKSKENKNEIPPQQEETKLDVAHIGHHKSSVGAVRAALVLKLGTARQNANIQHMDIYHIYMVQV